MSKTQIKFEKFCNTLAALEEIYLKPVGSDGVYIDATIQRFEFTFELAWKFLKDYFFDLGIELNYPKEILQKAFQVGLINNEHTWLNMLHDRNLTSHTYDKTLANEIYGRIRNYVPLLRNLVGKISLGE